MSMSEREYINAQRQTQSWPVLVSESDERDIGQAATLIDKLNFQNPQAELESLSQSLWSIVGSIRHAKDNY